MSAPSTMRLADLLAGNAVPDAAGEIAIRGLTLDSRSVRPGDAFIALQGETRHGIEFAAAARQRGAAAILAEAPLSGASPARDTEEFPVIWIAGLREQTGSIAARFFGEPSNALTVIGVTGTNGKTSTVQLLAQALHQAGHRVATIGTLGAGVFPELEAGERTTPDAISLQALLAKFRDRGASHLVMEVSSHAVEQGRINAVAFDHAVFTNLTRDHLDYHGSMAAYGAAKARLFRIEGLRSAIINIDDAFGAGLARDCIAPQLLTYACDDNAADLRASDIRTSRAGVAFHLETPWGAGMVQSALLGRFNVANLMAVSACLGALDWGFAQIAAALSRLAPVHGRMNRLGGDAHLPLVVVDYAHTPDALQKALSTLREHTDGALVCVFGCGGDRDQGKRAQMAAIAEKLADRVIVTDDNPRSEDGAAIVADIRAGFSVPQLVRVERDRAQAIRLAVAAAGRDDVVLIAGKGHETYQEIGDRKIPFDDLGQARAALESRPC